MSVSGPLEAWGAMIGLVTGAFMGAFLAGVKPLGRLLGGLPAGFVEIFREVADRTLDRIRGQPAQGAERSVDHGVAEIVEQLQVLLAVLAGDDAVDHLDAAGRADPAGRALAAGFHGAELHGEARL